MAKSRHTSSGSAPARSEEHTSELQSHLKLVCRLLLDKKKRQCRLAQVAALVIHAPVTQEGGGLGLARRISVLGEVFLLGGFSVALVFFFKVTATTEIYTLSLHDALPI